VTPGDVKVVGSPFEGKKTTEKEEVEKEESKQSI